MNVNWEQKVATTTLTSSLSSQASCLPNDYVISGNYKTVYSPVYQDFRTRDTLTRLSNPSAVTIAPANVPGAQTH